MKTGVCNAALGGIENVLAARLLRFRSEFRHCETSSFDPHLGPGRTLGARTASHRTKENERSFYLRRKAAELGQSWLSPRGIGPHRSAAGAEARRRLAPPGQGERKKEKKKGTSAKCVGALS
jgi:hypothetical protein